MKRVALLVALFAGHVALAAPLQDIRGREVPIGKGEHPTLVFYSNRYTRDVLRSTAFDFAYTVKEAQPIVVVRIDLSDLPGFIHPLTRGQISESFKRSIEHMRNVYRAHGETPPARLEDHVFFVIDDDGQGREQIGLKQGFSHAFVRVLDRDGNVRATVPFPEDAAGARKAVVGR